MTTFMTKGSTMETPSGDRVLMNSRRKSIKVQYRAKGLYTHVINTFYVMTPNSSLYNHSLQSMRLSIIRPNEIISVHNHNELHTL